VALTLHTAANDVGNHSISSSQTPNKNEPFPKLAFVPKSQHIQKTAESYQMRFGNATKADRFSENLKVLSKSLSSKIAIAKSCCALLVFFSSQFRYGKLTTKTVDILWVGNGFY
jgi:hypothetical protein